MKKTLLVMTALALSFSAMAKLPALSDEAKAKAAETAAKNAHGDKIAAYQLCKSREKVATHYYKTAKTTGAKTNPPTATPACVDPGAYKPADQAAAPAAAPAVAPAAAPAPAKKG
ncbi:MAG: hypothetical protein ACKOXU_11355 [Limnohabitans sp.]